MTVQTQDCWIILLLKIASYPDLLCDLPVFKGWKPDKYICRLDSAKQFVDHLGANSCPTLCASWAVARQAPLFMGFLRQEYWNRLSFLSPGDCPSPGIEPGSPTLQAVCCNCMWIARRFFTDWATREDAEQDFLAVQWLGLRLPVQGCGSDLW